MATIRVLLVDDHAVLRDGLRSLLSLQEDIEVVAEAGDGQEAIVCGQYRPDVVVMDIAMPRMNGLEATRQDPGALSGDEGAGPEPARRRAVRPALLPGRRFGLSSEERRSR